MPNFYELRSLNVCLLVFDALVTLFLLIGALTEADRKSQFMRSFIVLLISNILMQLGEAGIWFFEGSPERITELNISALISFVFDYLLIASYAYCMLGFIREKEKVSLMPAHIIAGICGVFILLSFVSLYNGMFFSFDENGHFVYGEMYGLVRAFDVIAVITEMLLVLFWRRALTLRGVIFLLSFSVLPILAVTVQFVWEPTLEYMAITLSLIIIYILFHGEITRQLAEKKMQLAESRISTMLSQIQPHFIYNILTTIRYLCRTDPEEAEKTVGQFSRYLRANMDSLSLKRCISFESEMEHVKTYLALEEKRFGDDIRVEFDIRESDFMLPALTVQPIMENAVKHAMRENEQLTIHIRTYSDEDNYYIEISDDGIGFDMNEVRNDGKLHIGIENVNNRLKMMCGGELIIKSVPEKGTSVSVIIPKS
ncbi:MAG: sensor histidine kinase [Monoglobaceae bacterium]